MRPIDEHPDCARDGCAHPWIAHRGPRDPKVVSGQAVIGECVFEGCRCTAYLDAAALAGAAIADDNPFADQDQPFARVRGEP